MKKQSTKTLKRKLWELISKYIRTKEKGVCFTCGAVKDIRDCDCGHFIHQAKYSKLAYDERILHCQCRGCNQFKSGNLLEYTLKMIKLYGIKQVEAWKREARENYKWKPEELNTLIEHYLCQSKAEKTKDCIK